jgi:hypothetical protein
VTHRTDSIRVDERCLVEKIRPTRPGFARPEAACAEATVALRVPWPAQLRSAQRGGLQGGGPWGNQGVSPRF